jgi:uncharacterized protein (DUF1800 family)
MSEFPPDEERDIPYPPGFVTSLRRFTAASVGLALAVLALLAQAAGGPLGFDDARHLLNRTDFAANPEEIRAFAKLTRLEAADRLLAETHVTAVTAPPTWVKDPFQSPRRLRTMTAEERIAARRELVHQAFELQSWWLAEMLTTPAPLTERMTLFWHNHFVSSQQKVRSPQLMYAQNELFRRHALGNFGQLLHAVARDPAMVIYLDSASNRKGQPNENFAREVMELFTLGEGAYSERDVKEAARAFTGWSLNLDTGEYQFRPLAHDDGVKTVLGHTANLDGDAVLDVLLAQPQTADFIVAKLWREFVAPKPDPVEIKRIGRIFRESGYDIRAALRAILVSDAFYSPQYRAALIKSPLDLVVGTLRQFKFKTGEVMPFVFTASQLGQSLFAPPNVKGWPGGEAWINATRLLARKAFLERIFRVEELRPVIAASMRGGAMDPDRPAGAARLPEGRERYARAMMDVQFESGRWLAQFSGADATVLERVVLAAAPANPPAHGLHGLDLIRHLTLDPVYQLK